ncbi:MAG: type III secretion system inner rod subunit SctI [Dongiaceae bacterium]
MIDPAQLQQLQQVVERAATGGGAGPGKADAGAVGQFEQALAGPQAPGGVEAMGSAADGKGTAGPADAAPAGGPANPGDAILQGLDKMRSSFADGMQRVGEVLGKDQVSAQDLMRAQMELQSISLQNDLMGKVGGKATQSIDQLMKGN